MKLFHRVIAEARAAFGNGDVYLEKYVTSLRHIEAQLLRDVHGNSKVLGLRDCSVQRDKQKILEESDSTMLPPELRQAVLQYTAQIADEIGYVGAGTVEFIFDLKSNAVYFMEMNTRLQVEHPVTELVSGVDIVGEQFRIASGESIAKLEIGKRGYALEARINAERIVIGAGGKLQFRPDPGQIQQCELPQEDGIEIITTAGPGQVRVAVLRQHDRAGDRARRNPARDDRQAARLPRPRADFRHLHEHFAAEDASSRTACSATASTIRTSCRSSSRASTRMR